jgi:hypothetical protein
VKLWPIYGFGGRIAGLVCAAVVWQLMVKVMRSHMREELLAQHSPKLLLMLRFRHVQVSYNIGHTLSGSQLRNPTHRCHRGEEGPPHHCRQLHVVVVITQEGAVRGCTPKALHQVLGSPDLA